MRDSQAIVRLAAASWVRHVGPLTLVVARRVRALVGRCLRRRVREWPTGAVGATRVGLRRSRRSPGSPSSGSWRRQRRSCERPPLATASVFARRARAALRACSRRWPPPSRSCSLVFTGAVALVVPGCILLVLFAGATAEASLDRTGRRAAPRRALAPPVDIRGDRSSSSPA